MIEIKLDGSWSIRLDRDNRGMAEHWEKEEYGDKIQIPGCLQGQGYGNPIDHETDWVSGLHDPLWYLREEYRYAQEEKVQVPFFSQPPRHFVGKAWYQKDFVVEESQTGLFARFFVEAVKWNTTLWLDGSLIGEESLLCTPHVWDLGQLTAGTHRLTLCIDNGMQLPYRPDGHEVSDALGATWNGMAGKVAVWFVPMVEICHGSVDTDIEKGTYEVKVQVWNHFSEEIEGNMELSLQGKEAAPCGETSVHVKKAVFVPGIQTLCLSGKANAPVLCWDEFSPNLYRALVCLKTEAGVQEWSQQFGFRAICSKDGKFYINGKERYFRGTHFGGDYPLTGYPQCDKEWWIDKLKIVKEWGMNFVRFHSYCPPEAAFQAADEEGVYLQVECGMWNIFTKGETPDSWGNIMTRTAFKEAEAIIRYFGNHPSFVMLSPSNEPGGDWLENLTEWVKKCKELDERRLYTIQSGWPYPVKPGEITGTDYAYFHRSGWGIQPGGTIRNFQGWKGKDYRASLEGIKYPVICHEMGQWCSYPDFAIIGELNGYMEPGNYRIFQESLKAHGMEGMDKSFSYHSGKLQVQMLKEDLEANFRTPHIYGFELLDLHDYLGQGTALVGVLNALWQPKGYVSSAEWKEFCNETVLLARISRQIFREGDSIHIPLEVCHFGAEALGARTIAWELRTADGNTAAGSVADGGTFPADIMIGKNQRVGEIQLSFAQVEKPEKLVLSVRIAGTEIKNHWNLWVYPKPNEKVLTPVINDIAELEAWDGKTVVTRSFLVMEKALEKGKKVLFFPAGGNLDYDCPPIPFRPAFWNSQMGPTWSRGMGILCDPNHPALVRFPTESWSEWQWEEVLQGARGYRLENLPKETSVIVRAIDEWNRNYPMSLIMECGVGEGSLLLASVDLVNRLEERPAAYWLRRSLEAYMKSENFAPSTQVSLENLRQNQMPHARFRQLGGRIYEEANPQKLLEELTDGNGDTFVRLTGGHPYVLCMEWNEECQVNGIYYLPRQNVRSHEGEIRTLRIEYRDGEKYQEIWNGKLPSSYRAKKIGWEKAVVTKKLRLTICNGFDGSNIRQYTEGETHWYSEVGDKKDTVFAAAVLDILTDKEMPEVVEEGLILAGTSKSATAEIDN